MTDGHEAYASHRRHVLSVARKYRQSGYSVMIPDGTAEIPAFLGDHAPDLIATSSNDNVVVEIRPASSLVGSNELVELARRLESEAGWRFELIALAGHESGAPMSRRAVDQTRKEVDALMEARFHNAAFIRALAATESLIASIAADNKIRPSSAALPKLTRTLVTRGLVSSDHLNAILAALEKRNCIVHDAPNDHASRSEIGALLAINDALLEEAQADAAA